MSALERFDKEINTAYHFALGKVEIHGGVFDLADLIELEQTKLIMLKCPLPRKFFENEPQT